MYFCTDCTLDSHNHEDGNCPNTWTDSTCGCSQNNNINKEGLAAVRLSGGKRANIDHSEWIDNWWWGFGKDESCSFEGPWLDIAIVAAKILRHPNTQKVAPNLYIPNIPITEEQERNY